MLSATRTEWNELYVVFSLLHQGQLVLGNAGGTPSDSSLPIGRLTRQEHDGKRDYTIHPDTIELTGEDLHMEVPREDFGTVAALILHTLKASHQDEPEAPEGVKAFLDALHIYDMEARTDDRTDFYLTFHDTSFPPMGFRIYSRLCTMPALLDGGRTANLKLRQEGIRFAAPAVNKINYTDTPDNADEVARRMLYIESMGGILKYDDVADKVFRANLQLIDLNMGRVLCDMVRTMHLDNVYKVNALTTLLEEHNPLKIKEEVIRKHGYYRYKVKQLLMAIALGMRPAKQYDGTESAVAGFVMADAEGGLLGYRKTEREVFANYLFDHTRLEKGSPEKDKYGYLERENGQYYLKLNLKIGFVKK